MFRSITIYCCIVALFCSVGLSASSFLQNVNLAEKVNEADFILEAKVLESVPTKLAGEIVTVHTLELYRYLKGESLNRATVEITTYGGVLGDDVAYAIPSLILAKGDVGIFFLKHAELTTKTILFEPSHSVHSFIRYDVYSKAAHDYKNCYDNIETDLIATIENQTGKESTLVKTNPFFDSFDDNQQDVVSITSFSPAVVTAGNGTILTIIGTGFGTTPGTILFENPDTEVTGDYIGWPIPTSWSDTEVQVVVPGFFPGTFAGAGTGKIGILAADGTNGLSTTDLTVTFNKLFIVNAGVNLEVDLVDNNGSGGYTFQLDNTFAANTDAVNSFKRALNTWTCKTGVNMTVSDTPTTADCTVPAMGPPSPGVNYVSFDNTCPVSAGLAGQARYFISGCTIGADTYAYISEIDVYIGNTVPWNYGTDCPDMNAIDFQSVMLHELGHGFGMGHVVNTGEVMFPSVVSGTHNRNLDQGALSCMSAVMAHSTTMGTCAINAMTQTTVCTPNQVSVEATVLLEGAYQSATNMNVNLRNPLNVIPLIQPFNQAPWNYAGTEAFATLGDLPANAVDWVLVEVRNAQTKCVEEQKAAILMGDGSLKDVDATVTSGVAFTTLNYCSNYYLSIKHRNHIAVMSSQVVTVPNVGSPYNFTATGAVEGGDTQMKEVATGIFAMKGGDYNSDGVVNTDDNTALVAAVGSAGSYLLTDGDLNAYVTVSDFNVQNNNQGTNGTVLCQ